jgi:hypothetical protein
MNSRKKPDMRKIQTVVMMTIVLTLGFLLSSAWADLFVAGNSGGDDTAAGTAEKPLATVKAALAKAQASGERKIVLLPGVHFAPEGLFIGEKLSGLAVVAQKPGTATLVGGVEVKGWKQDGADWTAEVKLPPLTAAGQWVHYGAGGAKRKWIAAGDLRNLQMFGPGAKAKPTPVTAAEMLLEDGRPLTPARFPNSGYLRVGERKDYPAGEGGTESSTEFRAKDVKIPAFDPTDARVYFWPSGYSPADQKLAWFDAETQMARFSGNADYVRYCPMNPGIRYFIYGADAFIDQPGEATLRGGMARVRPRGKQLGTVWAVTAPVLVHVHGAKDVRLDGLILSGSVNHVVQIDGGASCVLLRECLVANGMADGVFVGKDDDVGPKAHNVTVTHCLIRNNGRHGVAMWNTPSKNADLCFSNVVANCKILNNGRLLGDGNGVLIKNASRNRVEQNEIAYHPRAGVAISGIRFGALKELGPRVYPEGFGWETRYEFLHAKENVVAFNYIHHVMQDSEDGGGLYAWGAHHNRFENNYLHHAGNTDAGHLQMGIYLDDGVDYFTVTNNIVHDVIGTSDTRPAYIKGIGNRFEQNVLVVHPTADAAIDTFEWVKEPCEEHIYRQNVVLFEPRPGDTKPRLAYRHESWKDNTIKEADRNLFFSPDGPIHVAFGNDKIGKLFAEVWQKHPKGPFDAHSLIAGPGFVDLVKRDFRLRTDSPARQLGITPLDVTKTGVTREFPQWLVDRKKEIR